LLTFLLAANQSSAATIPMGDGPPIQLDITNTADFDYHFYQANGIIAPQYTQTPRGPIPNGSWDPTANYYFDWLNKLDTKFTYGPWHAELRLDSALFWNVLSVGSVTPIPCPGCGPGGQQEQLMVKMQNRFINNLVLEKLSASYITPSLEITIGDFYINYGRGIVLSLRKVDQLGVDTTLRGGNLTARIGNFSANFAAGITNNINTDQATAAVAPDAEDPILAARLEYRQPRLFAVSVEATDLNQNYDTLKLQPYPPAGPPNTNPNQCTSANHCVPVQVAPLSFGSVGALDQDPFLPLWQRIENLGGTLELPQILEHASAYFEYVHQWNFIENSARQEGNAFYGGINVFAGPVTVQAELKDYQNLVAPVQSSLSSTAFPDYYQQTVYTNPPNLEEIWQEEITSNPLSIWGPRIRVDWQVNENLRPYVAGAVFQDNGEGVNIYYGLVGTEANWQEHRSHLNINGGLRYELFNSYSPPHPPNPNQNLNQGESWVQYDVVQALTPIYSLELDGLHRNMNDCYGETPCNLWTQGYAYLSLKRTSVTVSGGVEYYTKDLNLYQPYYFNASGTWIASQALTFRAFVGGREGGLRCINGICRQFPAFNGVNFEIIARY
jgi:hypothetical protein